MTTRRQVVLAGALGALGARHVAAQTRLVRIGILSGRPLAESIYAQPVVQRLAELGYRDGAGMILEYRSSDGLVERYRAQARELIELKCDVIITIGAWQPARVLQELRSPVPTVFHAGDYDPVDKGIVASFSRPERNMTGVYAPQGLLAAKRLQILREVLPAARRFLVLADSFSREHIDAVRKAGAAVGVDVVVVDFLQQPYDFAAAFESGRRAGVEGLLLLNSPVFASHIKELSALTAKHRLPSVGAGLQGLMIGYHGDNQKLGARVAEMTVKILNGARPADIPVEQIDQFIVVINTKVARELGVKIPKSVLARATRIVE